LGAGIYPAFLDTGKTGLKVTDCNVSLEKEI
jgi:hypothetical protein